MLVELPQIVAAQEVIAGRLHHTPVIGSTSLSRRLGVNLFFKMELFQKTGSFKPRGVLNKLQHLTPQEKARGVITLSAGNHAQALAYAATLSGIRSTVVMPSGSIQGKIEATKGYGGEVILTEGNLLEECLRIQEERGLTLIHPFDDPLIIAGAGTVGMEILEDLPDVEAVIVGIGGGGLISGVATAIKKQKPATRIIGVEPVGAPGMTRSLQSGAPVHLDRIQTIADGLAAPFAGKYTLAHVQKYVDEIVLVSDEEIIEAMVLLLERCKVVAEPAAAATLTPLLTQKGGIAAGTTVVCLLSGGNIDRQRLRSIL